MKQCATVGCENLIEGNTILCGSCNRNIRKQVDEIKKAEQRAWRKLTKPKPVYKKPNNVSPKMQVELNRYNELRKVFLNNNPECQVGIEGCEKEATTIHHMIGRGKHLNDTKYWLACCMNCHVFIERNPIEAMKRNLSFSRLTKTI